MRLVVRNRRVADLWRRALVALQWRTIIDGLLLGSLVVLRWVWIRARGRDVWVAVTRRRRRRRVPRQGGRRGTAWHASSIESWLSKLRLGYAVARVDGGKSCNARCVKALLGHWWATRVVATAQRTLWWTLTGHRARRVGRGDGGIIPLLLSGADEQKCTEAEQADDNYAADSASDNRADREF